MLGHEGRGLIDDAAPRLRIDDNPDAAGRVKALAKALDESRPDTLVAIGPLSNLGALLEAGASLPPLAIMGGKLEDVMLEGTVPGIEEWNWFCDPLAVQRVLAARHSKLPRIVPAEVTFRTELAPGDVEQLGSGGPLALALATLCQEWLRVQQERLGATRPRVALHDPLTVATLVEPNLCPFEPRRIYVDDEGRTQREPGPPCVEVAVDVDEAALRDRLMEVWLS
jgi:pyrimidine-specific ribonucleoside hydrolase